MFREDDIICIVQKKPDEPIDHYIQRGIFIAKQKPTNQESFKEAETYSFIHINISHLGCEYNEETTKRYKQMLQTA